MKKKAVAVIILLIIMIAPAVMAQNKCEFIFKYGVAKKNILNTKENTFTKDMVARPGITAPLKLSRKEKKSIYKKLIEMNFFALPENYEYKLVQGETIKQLNPCSIYELEVFRHGTSKVVKWNNCISSASSKNEEFQKLMELADLINSVIINKKSYKNLPEPKSAYQ